MVGHPNINMADGPELIGTSAREYLKLTILLRRHYVIEQMGICHYRIARNLVPPTHKLQRGVIELYLELYGSLSRSYRPEDFNKLTSLVYSTDFYRLETALKVMLTFLDLKRLTRFDNRVNIDLNDPEGENLAFGL